MSIEVRKATEADVEVLNGIDAASDHWEWKDWVHPTAAKEERVLLAIVDGQPAGYLRHGDFLWDDREPFIQMVRVAEGFRRQGVASQLITSFIKEAEGEAPNHLWAGVYSSVDVANNASVKLHEKLGFTACGEPQALLGQDEPEILFARPFTELK